MNKIDSRTPEGRKALRLMTIETKSLIAALGLPAKDNRPHYSKATLCLMAVNAGLTPKDFRRWSSSNYNQFNSFELTDAGRP